MIPDTLGSQSPAVCIIPDHLLVKLRAEQQIDVFDFLFVHRSIRICQIYQEMQHICTEGVCQIHPSICPDIIRMSNALCTTHTQIKHAPAVFFYFYSMKSPHIGYPLSLYFIAHISSYATSPSKYEPFIIIRNSVFLCKKKRGCIRILLF